jgi:hypothetical protein
MVGSKNKILVILPQAGIGNKLSVWSRGLILSKKYNLDMQVMGWLNFRPKTWVSTLTLKRFYFSEFKVISFKELLNVFFSFFCSKVLINETSILTGDKILLIYAKYDFSFSDLKNSRTLIKGALKDILSKKNKLKVDELTSPTIGIHVRRDDFVKINSTTPLSFFINVIRFIRTALKTDIPIKVFSDGNQNEINALLDLDNVELSNNNSDILDLIEFSQSKVLITSIGSSFSYWAAFLSDGLVINSEKEWRKFLKSSQFDSIPSEWYIDDSNDELPKLLISRLKDIFCCE